MLGAFMKKHKLSEGTIGLIFNKIGFDFDIYDVRAVIEDIKANYDDCEKPFHEETLIDYCRHYAEQASEGF